MIQNYEEALSHMFQVDMLNEKGLRDYVKVLRDNLRQANIKIIGLDNDSKERTFKTLEDGKIQPRYIVNPDGSKTLKKSVDR